MQRDSLGPVLIFSSIAHAWFHVLVALFLTLVLVIEPIWQRPYDELIELWTPGALLLAILVTGWPVVAMAVIIVFVFDIAAPVENVLIARFISSRRRGLAYGVRNGIAIAAGPLGVQLVSWLFDEQAGFDNLLLALAGLVSVILLAALFLPSDRTEAKPLRA